MNSLIGVELVGSGRVLIKDYYMSSKIYKIVFGSEVVVNHLYFGVNFQFHRYVCKTMVYREFYIFYYSICMICCFKDQMKREVSVKFGAMYQFKSITEAH